MVLVDTSVWIDFLREGNELLKEFLENGQVYTHPFIVGELSCGNLQKRKQFLSLINELPSVSVSSNEEVNLFIEKTVSFHLEQLDEEQLFQPTKSAIMGQLKSCDSTTLMTMGLQRSRGVIQSALDQITLQKRELMNGTRKKQLVEWWLRFISSVVVKKLVSEYVYNII